MSQQNTQVSLANKKLQDVKGGPLAADKRSCTDIICCVLVLANFGVMVALALYGYSKGNTNNVYRATDQNQFICGATDTATANFPYSYIYNPFSLDLSKRTCVESCPGYVNGQLTPLNCFAEGNGQKKCSYDVTISQNGSFSQNNPQDRSNFNNLIIGYQSTGLIGRVCIPSPMVFLEAFANCTSAFSGALRQAGVANFVTDVQHNWRWLVLALVATILISIIFMFFLRWFAGCFVWVSLLLILVVLAGAGLIFLYNGGAISQSSFIGNMGISIPNLPSSKYYNIFGYIVFGVAAVFLILIFCFHSRISLAVALCGIAGRFIAQTCQIIFVPVVMAFFVFALWVLGLFAMVCLLGTATFVPLGSFIFTTIQSYTSTSLGYFYYMLFGTLWTNSLLMAITIFVIASACSNWYFEMKRDKPILQGYYMAFRYHFGSLAFGSILVAIIQFLQIIVELLVKQFQVQGAASNQCFQFVHTCVQCCLGCLQKIISFLNKNTYIVIAVNGQNFCAATSTAVGLMVANPLRYGFVSVIGYIMTILGKVTIVGLTTFLFYLFITFVDTVKASIQEPVYMLILVAIGSYAIAMVFMAIFDIAVDAMLVNFLIDEKYNSPSLHGPEDLRNIVKGFG